MLDPEEKERERLIRRAAKRPRPCIVCDNEEVVSIGTWIPDESQLFAAGGNSEATPVFAFWLCEVHAEATEENDLIIRQAVLRYVRTGEPYRD